MCKVLYILLIAVGAIVLNLHWENVEIFINTFKQGDPIQIDTVFGPLVGQTGVTRGGRTIYKFTSIPYAKQPVGQLRFEPPVPFGKWEGTLNATRKSPMCPQVEFLRKAIFGQEDCMYLNVYSPNIKKRKKLLPVMVFFYGGHFMFGSSDFYTPDYFLEEDVVLVTFNYRTNILGFLNTEDAAATGNQGLKDQSLVLQWVQEAIADFGGNPDQVTIFGNSAGGASVTYQMVSNMSRGLFHRAISQSGTNLCPWAFTQNPRAHAIRFAAKVGCQTTNSLDMVQCLKSKQVEDLMNIHFEILDIFHDEAALFLPSIEIVDENTDHSKIFLSQSPTKLMKEGSFHRVPWINGVARDEGCFRSAVIMSDPLKMNMLNEDWTSSITNLNFLPKDSISTLHTKVREEYFPSQKMITEEDLPNITNVISDRWFFSCGKESTLYHSKYAPVYLCYFNKKPDIGYGYILEATRSSRPTQITLGLACLKFLFYRHVLGRDEVDDYGVCHTDELQQLFMLTPELSIPVNSDKFQFSKELVKLWVSFAKNGKPDSFYGVDWNSYDGGEKLMYLKVDENPEMISEPFTARVQFWKKLKLLKN